MIKLDDNGVGAIVAALDIALKAGGLAALGPVSAAIAALETAKRTELEEAAAEQHHDVENGRFYMEPGNSYADPVPAI